MLGYAVEVTGGIPAEDVNSGGQAGRQSDIIRSRIQSSDSDHSHGLQGLTEQFAANRSHPEAAVRVSEVTVVGFPWPGRASPP